jgi:hypothetical protein
VAGSVRSQVAQAAAAGSGHGLALAQPGSRLPAAIYSNALATGISHGFLVASGIALAALVIALVGIRVTRTWPARAPRLRRHRSARTLPAGRWSALQSAALQSAALQSAALQSAAPQSAAGHRSALMRTAGCRSARGLPKFPAPPGRDPGVSSQVVNRA